MCWHAAAPRAASASRPDCRLIGAAFPCPCPALGWASDVRTKLPGEVFGEGKSIPAVPTIKSRPDFLAVRGGLRATSPSCVVEAKARPAIRSGAADNVRFGFTVTKKLGSAVVRNRIRRRLKAAVAATAGNRTVAGFDYVIVARSAAFDRPFDDVTSDLASCLDRIAQQHRTGHSRRGNRNPSA